MVFFCRPVVCLCGGDLILKRAEEDWIAIYSDLCLIQVSLRAECYTFVGGGVFSVTSLGAVA